MINEYRKLSEVSLFTFWNTTIYNVYACVALCISSYGLFLLGFLVEMWMEYEETATCSSSCLAPMETEHPNEAIACGGTNGLANHDAFPTRKQSSQTRTSWNVKASSFAKNTHNPIRAIVDGLKLTPNPDKHMIALSIGDPTVFGNFPPSKAVTDAIKYIVDEGKCNGYGPSVGTVPCRTALAEFYTRPDAPLQPKDVILTSGCSSAIELCISGLANAGENILVPRPGFPLYSVLAKTLEIEVKEYDLLPEKSWEIDVDHLVSCIDDKTTAIVVNNPSNPCGSVYKKKHLEEILAVAEKYKLPIIADEIYADMIQGGLICLSMRILGPNTLVQGALPLILANTEQSFYDETVTQIQKNAKLFYSAISKVPGLNPVMPQGAMYMMIGIELEHFPGMQTCEEFSERLVTEQSVFCLPGKAFNYPSYIRVVLTVPELQLKEACSRIKQFCRKHFNKPTGPYPKKQEEWDLHLDFDMCTE
ncbi:tyrosine aminotransferase-like isoform X2 [Lineus longissimus]|uniref:tyrosine aminotransferase-like isoform X2 n=1 Tax=Lineus longissimus TaxID=88925 RepID=UPI00315DDC43